MVEYFQAVLAEGVAIGVEGAAGEEQVGDALLLDVLLFSARFCPKKVIYLIIR